jgi:hypothetical protein
VAGPGWQWMGVRGHRGERTATGCQSVQSNATTCSWKYPGVAHMSNTYAGSCLCGEVRFEIAGEFERFYLCHCVYCRKDTGSAHAANLFASTAALKWVSGEEKVRQFNLPATRHSKCFCSTCGSALPTTQMNSRLLVVPAGSLDSDVVIAPNAHIFVSSRARWDDALEKVPTVDRFPS